MREVGGLVGRRVIGRLGVGRSFPKKTWGQGWARKKSDKENCLQRKKTELGKQMYLGKKGPEEKYIYRPLGDSFIPSMKSQNGIFWMVHG
jgi:hypothetical protein